MLCEVCLLEGCSNGRAHDPVENENMVQGEQECRAHVYAVFQRDTEQSILWLDIIFHGRLDLRKPLVYNNLLVLNVLRDIWYGIT